MITRIEYDQTDIQRLILKDIYERTGNSPKMDNIHIHVKSKQNYKSEWEQAEFRGVYHVVEHMPVA